MANQVIEKEINMLKSQKTSIAVTALVLSLVVAILVGFFVIRPVYKDNQLRDNIIDNREDVLVGYEDKLEKLKDLESDKEDIEEKVSKVKIAIPDNVDKARLIYQLNKLAESSEVSLESVSEESGADSESLGLNEAEFSVNLSGSYEGLRKFVQGINDGLRLVGINSISMSPDKAGESVDGRINVTTYFMGVEDEE